MEYSGDDDGDVGISSVHACFNILNSLSGNIYSFISTIIHS